MPRHRSDRVRITAHTDRDQPNFDQLDWAIAHAENDAVEFLTRLARGGTALELGVGTGRVAIPLTRCGVEVMGIEASEVMADQLRQKPGGDAVQVVSGDFADVAIPGEFTLVYCVFNTFFLLLTQAKQDGAAGQPATRGAVGRLAGRALHRKGPVRVRLPKRLSHASVRH